MIQASDIQRMIEQGLPGATVRVTGDDGQHFESVVVSAEVAGRNLVQQHHQLVYRAPGEAMHGTIHAQLLRTLTPEQAAAQGLR